TARVSSFRRRFLCARVLPFASRTRNEGWRSAEITCGCCGTAERALRRAQGACEAPASLGRRSPLGAPPWRFWAGRALFPHRTEHPDRSQRTPRTPVVSWPEGGCRAPTASGGESQARDATPRL